MWRGRQRCQLYMGYNGYLPCYTARGLIQNMEVFLEMASCWTLNFEQEPYNPMHRNISCMVNMYSQSDNKYCLFIFDQMIDVHNIDFVVDWIQNLAEKSDIGRISDYPTVCRFRTIHHKNYNLLILQNEYSWILKCTVSFSDWISKAHYPIGRVHSSRPGLKVIKVVRSGNSWCQLGSLSWSTVYHEGQYGTSHNYIFNNMHNLKC